MSASVSADEYEFVRTLYFCMYVCICLWFISMYYVCFVLVKELQVKVTAIRRLVAGGITNILPITKVVTPIPRRIS